MPKPLQFKPGSLIYCKGEEANKIFILQSGKISLVLTDIETGNDVRNPVQPGEFFGVKSALGRFPREENAIAMSTTTIMAFSIPEFETLVMSNTRIILKMLKVFSNQMRKTHAQVASLLETNEMAPEEGLFAIGEKYLKNKNYAYAEYVFSRYLEHYPTSENVEQAKKNLRLAETGSGGSTGKKQKSGASAKKEDHPAKGSAAARAYHEALNLVSQQKYQEALRAFNQIVDANEEREWTEKSAHEVGHCLFLLEDFDECIKYFTKFLAQYPKYPDARDAMFYIGQSYEKSDDKNQAIKKKKKIISDKGA
jgi:CRP-like cAMP-binding protein